ncbi:MAG: oxepin-CoA hydrolase / 3-oxo-5,6-dehydrosuberyl-CoA semialdehyde dehydrogenase [Bacteroidetes bacterium]|nr:oxepin-CoA hydrolase / 3-oxo-5,6-dehydrosuberyl-CoA semialdehyde dehydrogenase [Bacteroidota bacterium]
MLNIFDEPWLEAVLSGLKPHAKPLWGKMSPQHILEHLTKTLKVSVGKIQIKMYLTPEEGTVLKQKLIYGEMQLSAGIKSPILGDEPPALEYSDFSEALNELKKEIIFFKNYYLDNPQAMHMHPRMGELKHAEWEVFHNKHFTHHFKQYGLL